MDWKHLRELDEPIWRGAVFRLFPTTDYPYGNSVDFMLVENHDSPSGLAIMVATGYDAGCTLVFLPEEARSGDSSLYPFQVVIGKLGTLDLP